MKINAMYFSPTKTTEKVTVEIAKTICENLDSTFVDLNITKDSARKKISSFNRGDILILGLPVYGGRIPEIVEKYIHSLKGNKTIAIPISVYGNGDFGDALLEMKNILDKNGFKVIAACTFIGEHSFTSNLGTNRPDEKDLKEVKIFGELISNRIKNIEEDPKSINVIGNYPYRERNPFPEATFETTDDCTNCMKCVDNCPVDAIDSKDPSEIKIDKCFLCCECIKICPENAKSMKGETIIESIKFIEKKYSKRKEPELFI